MGKDITTNQWLAALEQAQKKRTDNGGMTTAEIADELCVSEKMARKIIRANWEQGIVERGERLIEKIDGKFQYVVTYKIVQKKK